MIISVFDRVENIVGKGEFACTSNFSFFHNVFKRFLSQTRQKVSLSGNGLNISISHRQRNKFTLDIYLYQSLLILLPGIYTSTRVESVGQRPSRYWHRSRESNSGPYDCKADALPHGHGHHTGSTGSPYDSEQSVHA